MTDMKFKKTLIFSLLVAAGFSAFADDYVYKNNVTGDAKWIKTKKGIIVADNDSIWAMQPFSYNDQGMKNYAGIANKYAEIFADQADVYLMPLPSQAAFYLPDAVPATVSRPVHPAMLTMLDAASDIVIPVDVYEALGTHAEEPIYARTDHHWLPLGAYYAARELAKAAEVPFRDLSEYNTVTVPGYVGSMYNYSGDIRVKQNPEPFTYYVPKNDNYTTTYIDYKLSGKNVVGSSPEKKGNLFIKTSTPAAYCTFGGGDAKIIKVETDVDNGRRILLLKDSFGNAITPFLLGSFEQVHVVDCRYFTKNIKKYIEDNGITDIVFCNNLSLAGLPKTVAAFEKYLVQ